MSLNFRFAVVSDIHAALPSTVWQHPSRMHLVEVGIPALEVVLERLKDLDLDFLLIPGDLTQHGEPENHQWMAQRLAQLPYPAYVIPGNHDIPVMEANEQSIAYSEFPHFYRAFGYEDPRSHDYSHEILPGVRLIGLNSNTFDAQGKQVGRLTEAQLVWLEAVLAQSTHEFVMVMIHHNVCEHMPQQSQQPLGKRYMLENAAELRQLLQTYNVNVVFTGHLHIQDVALQDGVYDITTGSLVSYPHPYRVFQFQTDRQGRHWLHMDSGRVEAIPEWQTLAQDTHRLMSDRSASYMLQLLMQPPLNLPQAEAEGLVGDLQQFWPSVANGDAVFDFAHFPEPARSYFAAFSSHGAIDNQASLHVGQSRGADSHRKSYDLQPWSLYACPLFFQPPQTEEHAVELTSHNVVGHTG
ncbi:metallophosphoesterase [Alkalinema sp. FACHB-956]|uniref:metallophosphoesterase family protein n=1 Tax=Alkalinema sp. FACHB-956 TaxID=2692768 RepID=UPI001689C295|nr:metallophosphoesterase [Alkalinema sp. FACHB-956]MBD2327018.1 metallophosphoesterase [Alkalinema sp. FACHB-956]